MLDLLDDQVDLLLADPQPLGPARISAITRSERYFFRCWAKTERDVPAWSHEMALATLRTFEGIVRIHGLREVTFGLRVSDVLKAVCVTILAHPETRMGYGLQATRPSKSEVTQSHYV